MPSLRNYCASRCTWIINLRRSAGWRFWVHDNGKGLPTDWKNGSTESFGQRLVATLVARVNAQITYSSEGGTKVEIAYGVSS
jgi:two-component sensor histidine kinase